jgi:16S rRNA processing protein RimM
VLSAADTTEIYLGKFVKAFGIKGELKFLASDDFWGEVFSSERLTARWLEDGELREIPIHIDRARPHGGTFVVKVAEVEDRNAAEGAVGWELFVDLDRLDVELPEYELPFQVIGMAVRLEDGRVIGSVRSVVYSAAHNVYEVAGEGGVVLIPAIPEFVVGRDAERGEITVRPIPGLIDG